MQSDAEMAWKNMQIMTPVSKAPENTNSPW